MAGTRTSQLGEIAGLMRELVRLPEAKMFYELLSDSLVWTDEIPEVGADQVAGLRSLRYVFRYRTSLMLGIPETRYSHFWEEARALFPTWPGFDPERRAPELRGAYESFHADAMREMGDLFGDPR
jgi:hypothetical protein